MTATDVLMAKHLGLREAQVQLADLVFKDEPTVITLKDGPQCILVPWGLMVGIIEENERLSRRSS